MKSPRTVQSAKPTVDIIIPTWNNPEKLKKCILSIMRHTAEPFRFIIVNNGDPANLVRPENYQHTVVLQQDRNLGWMGGVNAGLKYSLENTDAPFVCWMNDDTQILDQDMGWLSKMLYAFQLSPKVGAVGPMSNAIMGIQNVAYVGLPPNLETTMLSGMCLLTRKDIVREVGLLDESLPGGDDIDYSIRLRKAGYKLAICRRTFILHHYASTGRRIHGEYWDSPAHTEAINTALIKKHGFECWYNATNNIYEADQDESASKGYDQIEAEFASEALKDELENGIVLDLGCGGRKFHPKAIGVDLRPNGQLGVGVNTWFPCAGEIEADCCDLKDLKDASVDAIVAKHLLEHVMDIPKALKEWRRVLRPGGKLLIICPDYRFCEAMACDPSHVHGMTAETVKSWLDTVGGFQGYKDGNFQPGYVFHLLSEKSPVPFYYRPKMEEPVAAVAA